jgi:hypothetical protein
MITIPQVTAELVDETPLLEDSLARGIINLSALARELQPEIEARTMKPVQIGAIVAALKRLLPALRRQSRNQSLAKLGDISVRADLVEYNFTNSTALSRCHQNLIKRLERHPQVFFNLTQGVFETNIIVSRGAAADVEASFAGAELRSRLADLAAITLLLPPANVDTPGTYYNVLKVLFRHSINLVEVVSTAQELTLVLRNADIERAFSVIQQAFYRDATRR